jgi:hypothetical protein
VRTVRSRYISALERPDGMRRLYTWLLLQAQGAAEPVPCPAGYLGNTTGLYSPGQCTPVPVGFWAPLGSSAPEPCPTSGFFCPGALRDEVYGGARPVLLPVGQSTVTRQVESISKDMTLDVTVDDFAVQRASLVRQLATQYGVDPSLITLEACSPARCRFA